MVYLTMTMKIHKGMMWILKILVKKTKKVPVKGDTVPYHLKMFFFLFNTFHSQFVQFGHLVESIYICVPSLSREALNVSPFMLQIFFFFFFRGGNLHRHLTTPLCGRQKVVPDSYRLKPPRAGQYSNVDILIAEDPYVFKTRQSLYSALPGSTPTQYTQGRGGR